MPTTVDRLLPTEEAEALLELTRELATKELAPQVHDAEEKGEFPAAAYALLGKSGLMSLPFAEELRRGRPAVRGLPAGRRGDRHGLAERRPSALSVHSLTASVVAANATEEQCATWLPRMLGGELARCLLPVRAAGRVRRQRHQDPRRPSTATRTSSPAPSSGSATARAPTTTSSSRAPTSTRRRGLSAFVVPADTPGMSFGAPEKKMGLACDVTTQVLFDGARIPVDQRIGARGRRHEGRALRARLRPARHRCRRHRHRPGCDGARGRLRPRAPPVREGRSASSRGCSSCSPSSAAETERARATYLHAARLKDAGRPFSRQASHREADRHRRGHARLHRRRPGARRQRLHPRLPRRAASSATPRSPRSSRAPTRSSGWSSAATSCADRTSSRRRLTRRVRRVGAG